MHSQAGFIFIYMINNTFEILRVKTIPQMQATTRVRKECADLVTVVEKLEKANEKTRLKYATELRQKLKKFQGH